ncbi:hypothetical protein AWB65_03576 [Caballeronia humi]|uniref:Uncharacterized protein n=1 Tax=Caballeronia humi TaxID=326474 RepID=A0A158HML1_9BURK|nr:hypothetical protein AWB65_03576 [Caballeronia humi]
MGLIHSAGAGFGPTCALIANRGMRMPSCILER